MLNKIKVDIFDNRKCVLGEGPTSSGEKNNHVMWVDIINGEVLWRNFENDNYGKIEIGEHVSFAIPRQDGGEILGTVSGPIIREPNGKVSKLPNIQSKDLNFTFENLRWNDAKVSNVGDLWLGTMSYNAEPKKAALYRYSIKNKQLEILLDQVTVSNGMDWSLDGDSFFYIDSAKRTIDKFDLNDERTQIKNRKVMWEVRDERFGIPDGMTIDAEDGLWVAFWGGSAVRRFDKNFRITHEIEVPAKNVTSCTFAGEDLETLIITTASNGDSDSNMESGMTFMCAPGISGRKINLSPL
jgi:sugar lactone lactonase YvrE